MAYYQIMCLFFQHAHVSNIRGLDKQIRLKKSVYSWSYYVIFN